ncbi:NIPSNAP family containing protein [Niastella yeongjuensis]|uniref:NIPSNAP family containing protein n=1 Tax=Niastella yeongjuensis TaxID=354355 RepID=A0A1V9EWD1_9BACT|nr:NIPSNAP family protein [Niastella yeongjuensis]OQP50451.1 NIPSNAP family containing protein [Niastella yeongjuensis]SEN33984.1 NIPSNAP protein [Niastella yeongjuensis]
MKRRNFIQTAAMSSALLAGKLSYAGSAKAGKKELFEIREYEIHFGGNQNALHAYLEKALIPAFNKFGVKNVGVFKEIGKSEPAKVYVLIVYPSMEEYGEINMKVKSDSDFKQNSTEWDKIPAEKPVFNRYNSTLLVAFDNMPSIKVPAKETRIFELRTYEGYNEDAVRRKVKMFNEEEFTIFDRTRLNRVFFGEAISGPNLPCLTYMITFKNMEERDKNWAAFGADTDWKKVSNDPIYANTVSNIRRVFLEPTPYSQV